MQLAPLNMKNKLTRNVTPIKDKIRYAAAYQMNKKGDKKFLNWRRSLKRKSVNTPTTRHSKTPLTL